MVKAKIGELEDEFREVFSRWMSKYLTIVLQIVSSKRRFLVRFRYCYENYMT